MLADPAARDMARWAAWRKLTPAALYGISLGLGLIAAVWFSELAVRAKLLAVAALAASFLCARAGSLLAAASRDGRIRPAVDWLGAACGLLTELAVYAALAVSAGLAVSSGDRRPGRGGRAGRALRRRAAGYRGRQLGRRRDGRSVAAGHRGHAGPGASAGWPSSATSTRPGRRGSCSARSVLRTLEQALTLPAGERFVVIVVTAVFFGPRLTFLVLLGWGVLAAGYVLAGRLARSADLDPVTGPAGAGWRPTAATA